MWKVSRGIQVENDRCRLCGQVKETMMHWISGCVKLVGREYLRRHDNVLMVLCVAWGIQLGLLKENTKWYKESWNKGKVIQNEDCKLSWDFEYHLCKTTTARRPDVTIELEKKTIYLVDMACPNESNVNAKHLEKIEKYQQLAFEIRERHLGYKVMIIPIVIGCLGGGIKRATNRIRRIIKDENRAKQVANEMLKSVLFENETIVRKVLSGLVQED